MNEDKSLEARTILEEHLEAGGYHKTAERYAIFEAAYAMDMPFTIDALRDYIDKTNIRISRATVYNALNLFIKLKLMNCHPLPTGMVYDVHRRKGRHIYQYCYQCGTLTKVTDADVEQAIESMRHNRFHRDGFNLYVYGVCNSCYARQNRKRKNKKD